VRVRKSAVVATLVWLAGLALALAGPSLLPERYYYDADTIRTLIADRFAEHSPSFHATARIYAWLGMGTVLPEATARIFGFTVAWAAILWSTGWIASPWRPALALLVSAWAVPLAIYHGQYSKEVFAIATVAVMLRLCGSTFGIACAAAVALAYAALFRNYWAVVVALWLVLLVGWRARLGWTARLSLMVAALVPLSLASRHFVGLWLSDGRTITVEGREGELDSATIFFNLLINTSPATDIINTLAGWLTLTFPLYLLALGAAQHVAFALFQLVNTALFIRVARATRAFVRNRRPSRFERRTAAAAAWCVAYTVVLGMLEPDFGSFVKHETNMLPMLIFLLARVTPGAAARSHSVAPQPLPPG
jgi:hypothetical protein